MVNKGGYSGEVINGLVKEEDDSEEVFNGLVDEGGEAGRSFMVWLMRDMIAKRCSMEIDS